MIVDFEVERWEYVVYFRNEEGIPRLVASFTAEAEAKKCIELITDCRGLDAWYKPELSLKMIRR